MASRHEVLHIRRQKQRLIDIPRAKILAHRPRLNQTRSELNSDYSDTLLGGFFDPGRTPLHDSIGVDRELASAGDERCVMDFAVRHEAGIQRDQSLVPTEGSWKGGGE